MVHLVGTTAIGTVHGDLTRQNVHAIVNAANERLAHGGGVAAAIVRAGGRTVQDESDAWIRANGPVQRGQAAVTSAGVLPADVAIHVVGPRYRADQNNEVLLRESVRAALDAAADVGARSVAFPAISAGIFGYPRAEATSVVASEIVRWVTQHPDALDEIRLVGFDHGTTTDFEEGLSLAVEDL